MRVLSVGTFITIKTDSVFPHPLRRPSDVEFWPSLTRYTQGEERVTGCTKSLETMRKKHIIITAIVCHDYLLLFEAVSTSVPITSDCILVISMFLFKTTSADKFFRVLLTSVSQVRL